MESKLELPSCRREKPGGGIRPLQAFPHQSAAMLPLFDSTVGGAYLAEDFETWYACRNWRWNEKPRGEVAVLPKTPIRARFVQNAAKAKLLSTPLVSPPILKSSSSSFSSSSSSSSTLSRAEFLASLISPPSTPKRPAKPFVLFTTEYFEVRKSPKGGYGAFALKNIEIGTVVISEEPLFHTRWSQIYYKYEFLSPEQKAEYRKLHGCKTLSECPVEAIYMTNRFTTKENHTGIFLKCSRFNHSCNPYAVCSYVYDETQDRMVVSAKKRIQKGEEITICYTEKAFTLFENYGFYCDCPGCATDGQKQRQQGNHVFPSLW